MTKTTPSQFEQERLRKKYDGMARAYAATGQLIAAHRHEASAALGVQPGERILDLACGPGVNFKSILKDLGTGGLLVGLAGPSNNVADGAMPNGRRGSRR